MVEVVEIITGPDRAMFMGIAPGLTGLPAEALNIEEVDIHWQVLYAIGDRGSASSAFDKMVTIDLSPSARNKAVQTQDPLLKGEGVNAGDQLIGMFAIGARFAEHDIATTANARAILGDLEKSIVLLENSSNRRCELFGDTLFGSGSDIGTDANATPGRYPGSNKRTRKLGAPFTIGKEQKFSFTHRIGRTTDWPVAFSVDFYASVLIARKK